MNRDRAPLITFAAAALVAIVALGWYVDYRAGLGDRRYDRQRHAICQVLASLPGRHALPSIEHLRAVEARPSHPRDCYPQPKPTATPSEPKAESSPSPARAVFVVPSSGGGVSASPRPAPHPSPTSTPTPHPTGTPTPSPTCELRDLIRDPTHCLHL